MDHDFRHSNACLTCRHFDTFDGAKPRFLNRGKKRRSVLTLRIPRASARGFQWVDWKRRFDTYGQTTLENQSGHPASQARRPGREKAETSLDLLLCRAVFDTGRAFASGQKMSQKRTVSGLKEILSGTKFSRLAWHGNCINFS